MTIKVYSIDEVVEERTLDEEKIKNIQKLFKFLIGEQKSQSVRKVYFTSWKTNKHFSIVWI